MAMTTVALMLNRVPQTTELKDLFFQKVSLPGAIQYFNWAPQGELVTRTEPGNGFSSSPPPKPPKSYGRIAETVQAQNLATTHDVLD